MSEEFEFNGKTFRIGDFGGIEVKIEPWKNIDYGQAVEEVNPRMVWFHGRGGSYEGEWLSVGYEYGPAPRKWYAVNGSFGSCSGCDTMEALRDANGAMEFLKGLTRKEPIGTTADEIQRWLGAHAKNGWSDTRECVNSVIGAINKSNVGFHLNHVEEPTQ
jgi:hypothetical protein